MKIGIVILARNSSSRLPGKILKPIMGKPIIEYIIERLLCVLDRQNIIVATSTQTDDDLLEYYCTQHNIDCYRGDLNNVSLRFLNASKKKKFDYTIRINGDNLFVDIPTLKEMISLIDNNYEFITNVKNRTFPKGMSIEIIKTDIYEKLYTQFKTSAEFEHVTKFIYDNENKINFFLFENKICPEASKLQMAIDTEYDYRLASKIIKSFKQEHIEYNLKDIFKKFQFHKKTMSFVGKYGPLLIAEIGGNHEGDFEYAKKLTKLAIESDADYIKFQVYSGDTLVNPLLSPNRNKHFKKFELSKEQYIELAEMVEKSGKKFMASIWEASMFDWLDQYMPVYKVGSGDLQALPLLKKMAEKNKPIILSTGLATEEEVLETIEFIQGVNTLYKDKNYLSILQCTSMYPIPFSASNLSVIMRLKSLTDLTIGYSDHTEGYQALFYSVAMGAEVLEFHFTDSRDNKKFRDHKVSLTKDEVKLLIQNIKDINELSGDLIKKPTTIEKLNGHISSFRRGIFLNKDIPQGHIISEEDLIILRPHEGISSKYFYKLIGKQAKVNLTKYNKLEWSDFQ
ncbi:MAG: N-acetylneuraminate synthase (EC [uncultured Sulfurovum sp.]|uniref:N-acetylneuraminate synthase (EC) n=1 Tax=uncultured Sulfurovum sp. TaxID=269237 RepID=A0A6S6TAK0_9BACT|nr:MAG: N-acetylneuraminate synthase (EC [uncultured Sulfurovum sp.]